MVSETISHYRIIKRIGAGGMGEVYLADDTKLRRKVALKLLSSDVTHKPDLLHRFEQEAQAASALNHPNILTIYEVGEEKGAHFIATEFVEGDTLRKRMARSQMSIRDVVDVAMQTASALSAAHAAGTSALLPMLALGIPGSPTAAVLLGGLLIWGLQPGPLLFTEQKDFVWGLIASMYLGNLAGLVVVLTTVPLFASILRIPFSIIAPVIIVICAIGAYTVHNAMLDIWFMLGFGVIGYLFKKLDFPLAPMVLALVLGDKAEDSFRQAMLMSQGELLIMWANPLVGTITTLALVLLFWPVLAWVWKKLRPGKPDEFAAVRPVD